MKRPLLKNRHRHLLQMVKDNWGRMVMAMFCMLVMAGTEAGIPFLMKPAIDDIFIKQDLDMLKLIPLVVILLYIVKGVGHVRPGVPDELCGRGYHPEAEKSVV